MAAIGAAIVMAAIPGTSRPCHAQEADSARAARDSLPIYRGAEIEVRVARSEAALGRLPFAIDVRDRESLQRAERALSLDEALRFVPGVFVQNRRNIALGDRVTARGVGARAQFGVRGVRVLADGIPLTLPDGQSTLTNLDLASAGRVEVIRGPASALYGNAAGGVLAYRTERPTPGPLRLEPYVQGGSHGFLQGRLEASGHAGAVGLVANASWLHTEGFREHSEAEVLRANLVATRPLGGGGEVRALVNLYRTPFAENPSSLSLEDALADPRHARDAIVAQGAGEAATQGHAGVAFDLPLDTRTVLRATAWGLRRDLWNPIPGRIIRIDRWAGGVRSEITTSGPGDAPLRWVGGLDLEVQADDRVESANLGVPEPGGRASEGARLLDQRERVLGVGPFLQLELELGARWVATLAGRIDLYRFVADDRFLEDGDDSGERTFTRGSPVAGLVFRAADGLALYGNLATAFQTPTTSELSNRPDGSGGFNDALQPERIWSVEIGARGTLSGPRLGYTFSAFRAEVNDALIPFEGATEEVFFRNAGEVERSGIEASLGWAPAPPWELELAYTLQRLRFTSFSTEAGDFSGNAEPGVPDHWLTIGLVHETGSGVRGEANLRWVDAYPVNDANTASNPSARVVDLRVSLDRTDRGWPLRLFLGVDNLFDERYSASVV
ncbi:MAG: TonB-dependent receptor, partial [Gemmatimonadota bacterium]